MCSVKALHTHTHTHSSTVRVITSLWGRGSFSLIPGYCFQTELEFTALRTTKRLLTFLSPSERKCINHIHYYSVTFTTKTLLKRFIYLLWINSIIGTFWQHNVIYRFEQWRELYFMVHSQNEVPGWQKQDKKTKHDFRFLATLVVPQGNVSVVTDC